MFNFIAPDYDFPFSNYQFLRLILIPFLLNLIFLYFLISIRAIELIFLKENSVFLIQYFRIPSMKFHQLSLFIWFPFGFIFQFLRFSFQNPPVSFWIHPLNYPLMEKKYYWASLFLYSFIFLVLLIIQLLIHFPFIITQLFFIDLINLAFIIFLIFNICRLVIFSALPLTFQL
jgi:hypothetical protein